MVQATFTVFGIVFGAAFIWLTVRVINRRGRWATWTFATMIGVPLLYVLSYGPALWLYLHVLPASSLPCVNTLYAPLGAMLPRHWVSKRIWLSYQSLWVDMVQLMDKIAMAPPDEPRVHAAESAGSAPAVEVEPFR